MACLKTKIIGRMPVVYSKYSKPILLVLQMKRTKDTNSTHVPKRKVNPLILSYVQQEYFPGPVTLETYKTLFSVTI